MRPVRIFLLLSLCTLTALQAQTLKELFSRPGLSIGSYHYNFFDGSWRTSHRYIKDSLLCGDTLLIFDGVSSLPGLSFYKITGKKVYAVYNCNAVLLYDFGLNVGEDFPANGINPSMKVQSTDSILLLNGEKRRRLTMSLSNNNTAEWVEGLGDIRRGFRPLFADFEGGDAFVCARDFSGDLLSTPPLQGAPTCDSALCVEPRLDFTVETNNYDIKIINKSAHFSELLWDFGDGSTSTEVHPTHTYSNIGGCYIITLKAKSSCFQRSFSTYQSISVCLNADWVQADSIPMPMPNQSPYHVEFVSEKTGWLVSYFSLYKTTDGAKTWTEQILPPAPAGTTRRINSLHMTDSLNGVIGCGYYNGGGQLQPYVMSTNDGGQSWTIEFAANDYFWASDAIAKPNGQRFAVSQYEGLTISEDFGANWTKHPFPQPGSGFWHPEYVFSFDDSTAYVYCFFEGFQGTSNHPRFAVFKKNGANWTCNQWHAFPPIQGAVPFCHFIDAQHGFATGTGGKGLWQTKDGGQSWQEYPFIGAITGMDFSDALKGWAVGPGGLLMRTADGGQTWHRQFCGNNNYYYYDISAPDNQNAFCAGNPGLLLQYAPSNDPPCDISQNTETPHKKPRQLNAVPNPSHAVITLWDKGEWYAPNKTSYVRILNALGQYSKEVKLAGHETPCVNIEDLAAGCYFVQLVEDGKLVGVSRFVKQ